MATYLLFMVHADTEDDDDEDNNNNDNTLIFYSIEIGKNTPKPSTAQVGQFLLLFQAGKQRNGNIASPPLSVGDSRYSAAKPKARQPWIRSYPQHAKKHKKGLIT